MDLSLCQSLLKWLRTFSGHEDLTIPKLTDGVAIAKTLTQIAPEFFSQQWMSSRIKGDVGDNWRLKVSNLRKIHESVMDYYREHLDQPVGQIPSPDLKKIGELADENELGRLLQLVLGCAINCQQKQRYIEAIMGMEENVQTVLVNAIQELIPREGLNIPEGRSPVDPPEDPMKAIYEKLDQSATRCYDLEHQLSLLTEERDALKRDKGYMLERIEFLQTSPDEGVSSAKLKELRKKTDGLQDELFKVESSRDEYRLRVDGLEKENAEISRRISELQTLADQSIALKDEVDVLRDMKQKVEIYEGLVESYKKKMEELGDLRRQVKTLQDKNSEYMQHNMELEEAQQKYATWRRQWELSRQQVTDLHQKLSEETKNVDRMAFDNKKLNEKLDAEIEEKKRIQEKLDSLSEKYDELKNENSSNQTPMPPTDISEISDVETVEMIPPEIRERLARLQFDNHRLKESARDGSDPALLQSELSDIKERHDKLLRENRGLNQQILQLESDLYEAKIPTSKVDSSSGRISELERQLALQTDKISTLEENLSKKETEMVAMEERYKRYLNKAKSVIRTLDPKHNPSLVPDVSVLRSQLLEKEKLIENMERESEKSKKIRETEEKLITTAFYNIGMQRHRQMVSQRLANLDQSQSFLSRQRQSSARKNISNSSNSEFQY